MLGLEESLEITFKVLGSRNGLITPIYQQQTAEGISVVGCSCSVVSTADWSCSGNILYRMDYITKTRERTVGLNTWNEHLPSRR